MRQPVSVLQHQSGACLPSWLQSRDIPLAMEDGILELRTDSYASDLEWLGYAETVYYHRQLFFWKLHPLLWAYSRTGLPEQNRRLELLN